VIQAIYQAYVNYVRGRGLLPIGIGLSSVTDANVSKNVRVIGAIEHIDLGLEGCVLARGMSGRDSHIDDATVWITMGVESNHLMFQNEQRNLSLEDRAWVGREMMKPLQVALIEGNFAEENVITLDRRQSDLDLHAGCRTGY